MAENHRLGVWYKNTYSGKLPDPPPIEFVHKRLVNTGKLPDNSPTDHVVLLTRESHPDFYAVVKKSCDKLGIQPPPIYIHNSTSDNATFSRHPGLNEAVLFFGSAVTKLTPDAQEIVVLHELGHGLSKNILYSSIDNNIHKVAKFVSARGEELIELSGASGLLGVAAAAIGLAPKSAEFLQETGITLPQFDMVTQGSAVLSVASLAGLAITSALSSTASVAGRFFSHATEFGADRVALEHADRPEALTEFHTEKINTRTPLSALLVEGLKIGDLSRVVEEAVKRFLGSRSHPTDESRVSHGERIIAERKAKGAARTQGSER